MDGRILALAPSWSPDTATFLSLPIGRALTRRLEAVCAVDWFDWPTAHGRWDGAEPILDSFRRQFREQVSAQHHVLDIAATGAGILLKAVVDSPARSLIVADFYPSPETLRRLELHSLAAAMEGVYQLASSPTQAAITALEGSDPNEERRILQLFEENVDHNALSAYMRDLVDFDIAEEDCQVTVPALCLKTRYLMPGEDERRAIFQSYAPLMTTGDLKIFPFTFLSEEPGHELAGHVVRFIKKVERSR
ncbi:MAG: hypothetical protein WEB00_15840 [Dehalococcoidia bacterium]